MDTPGAGVAGAHFYSRGGGGAERLFARVLVDRRALGRQHPRMPHQGRVVIVTGPPGPGKPPIARLLAEAAGDRGGVHLHGDDFLGYIRAGFVAPHLPASAHQNLTLSRALAAAAFTYADGGYLVVLDWVVG